MADGIDGTQMTLQDAAKAELAAWVELARQDGPQGDAAFQDLVNALGVTHDELQRRLQNDAERQNILENESLQYIIMLNLLTEQTLGGMITAARDGDPEALETLSELTGQTPDYLKDFVSTDEGANDLFFDPDVFAQLQEDIAHDISAQQAQPAPAAFAAGSALPAGAVPPDTNSVISADGDPEQFAIWTAAQESGKSPYDPSIFKAELTNEKLAENESFLQAAKVLYDMDHPDEPWDSYVASQAAGTTDAEMNVKLSEWALQYASNLSMSMDTGIYTVATIDDWTPEQQTAMLYTLRAYEHNNISVDGVGRAAWSMLTDKVTWGMLGASFAAGFVTAGGGWLVGAGAIGTRIASQATARVGSSLLVKQLTNKVMGSAMGSVLTHKVTQGVVTGGLIAGAESLASDYFINYDFERTASSTIDHDLKYDTYRGAMAFGTGTILGGGFGGLGSLARMCRDAKLSAPATPAPAPPPSAAAVPPATPAPSATLTPPGDIWGRFARDDSGSVDFGGMYRGARDWLRRATRRAAADAPDADAPDADAPAAPRNRNINHWREGLDPKYEQSYLKEATTSSLAREIGTQDPNLLFRRIRKNVDPSKDTVSELIGGKKFRTHADFETGLEKSTQILINEIRAAGSDAAAIQRAIDKHTATLDQMDAASDYVKIPWEANSTAPLERTLQRDGLTLRNRSRANYRGNPGAEIHQTAIQRIATQEAIIDARQLAEKLKNIATGPDGQKGIEEFLIGVADRINKPASIHEQFDSLIARGWIAIKKGEDLPRYPQTYPDGHPLAGQPHPYAGKFQIGYATPRAKNRFSYELAEGVHAFTVGERYFARALDENPENLSAPMAKAIQDLNDSSGSTQPEQRVKNFVGTVINAMKNNQISDMYYYIQRGAWMIERTGNGTVTRPFTDLHDLMFLEFRKQLESGALDRPLTNYELGMLKRLTAEKEILSSNPQGQLTNAELFMFGQSGQDSLTGADLSNRGMRAQAAEEDLNHDYRAGRYAAAAAGEQSDTTRTLVGAFLRRNFLDLPFGYFLRLKDIDITKTRESRSADIKTWGYKFTEATDHWYGGIKPRGEPLKTTGRILSRWLSPGEVFVQGIQTLPVGHPLMQHRIGRFVRTRTGRNVMRAAVHGAFGGAMWYAPGYALYASPMYLLGTAANQTTGLLSVGADWAWDTGWAWGAFAEGGGSSSAPGDSGGGGSAGAAALDDNDRVKELAPYVRAYLDKKRDENSDPIYTVDIEWPYSNENFIDEDVAEQDIFNKTVNQLAALGDAFDHRDTVTIDKVWREAYAARAEEDRINQITAKLISALKEEPWEYDQGAAERIATQTLTEPRLPASDNLVIPSILSRLQNQNDPLYRAEYDKPGNSYDIPVAHIQSAINTFEDDKRRYQAALEGLIAANPKVTDRAGLSDAEIMAARALLSTKSDPNDPDSPFLTADQLKSLIGVGKEARDKALAFFREKIKEAGGDPKAGGQLAGTTSPTGGGTGAPKKDDDGDGVDIKIPNATEVWNSFWGGLHQFTDMDDDGHSEISSTLYAAQEGIGGIVDVFGNAMGGGYGKRGRMYSAYGFGLIAALIGTPLLKNALGISSWPLVGLIIAGALFFGTSNMAFAAMTGESGDTDGDAQGSGGFMQKAVAQGGKIQSHFGSMPVVFEAQLDDDAEKEEIMLFDRNKDGEVAALVHDVNSDQYFFVPAAFSVKDVSTGTKFTPGTKSFGIGNSTEPEKVKFEIQDHAGGFKSMITVGGTSVDMSLVNKSDIPSLLNKHEPTR